MPLPNSSTNLLWRSVLAIVVGVIAVTWPDITVGAFVVLFAVYAFLNGAMDAARAFGSDRFGPVAGWLLLSLLSVIAAVVALAWPSITALALTVWIGVWALVTGFVEIGLTFGRGESTGERALWALNGLVSVLFGFALSVRPDIGALTLAAVFGLFSLVYGVAGVILALEEKRLLKDAAKTGGTAPLGV